MNLKSITVGNFKNIAETTINLNTIIALISANNYGKSNLLEAIHFGFDFISSSSKGRSSMMSWTPGIPLTPNLAGKDYIFAIEFEDPDHEEYKFVRYMFRIAWPTDETEGTIVDETIEMRSNDRTRYTTYLKRDKGQYRASKNERGFRNISLPSNVLAIDILSAMNDIGISESVAQIKSLSYSIYDTLEVEPYFHPSLIEFDFGIAPSVSFDNKDIPNALNTLRKNHPEKYNLIIEAIYNLFPEFKDVELKVYALKENEHLKIQKLISPSSDTSDIDTTKTTNIPYHIKDEVSRLIIESRYLNQPISMEYMSTGTKRIIWLITNAIFADCNGIDLIGVEEIETCIHPRLVYELLETLNNILEKKSMIVTSHSPYLIQYLKPESIYIGIPNDDGVAIFRRIHRSKIKTLLKIARGLEISMAEYLFDLLSGDEDSASILKTYLED